MEKKQADILSDFDNIPKWALTWESRAKLIAAVIYIFGTISLTTPLFAFISFSCSLIAALSMRLSVVSLLKRYLLIAPFILLMTIPLVLGGGLPLEAERISFASLIILKAITSMTVMTIILTTQSSDDFMNSLAHLKVPPVMITILLLSYRYVFLFLDDIQKMQLAVKTRLFTGGISIRKLKVYGQLTGSLLVRSFDRSDKVYNAMASRCFTGTLKFGQKQPFIKADINKIIVPAIFIALLITIEKLL